MPVIYYGNGYPINSTKQNRNELCKCKSGKKAKRCCGADAQLSYSKLNEKQKEEIERRKTMMTKTPQE